MPPASYCVLREYSFSDVFGIACMAILNRIRNNFENPIHLIGTQSHLTYLYYTNNVIGLDYNMNIIIKPVLRKEFF